MVKFLFSALALLLASSGYHCSAQIQDPSEKYRAQLPVGTDRGNAITTTSLDDGRMYLTAVNGNVYILNQTSGDILTTYERNDPIACNTFLSWDASNTDNNPRGVYSVGNTVIVMSSEGEVLNEFEVAGNVAQQPIIRFGVVWVAHNTDAGGEVTAYDVVQGEVMLNAKFGGVTIGGVSRTGNEGVYFGTNDGKVYFINYLSLEANIVATGLNHDLSTGTPYTNQGGSDLIFQSESGQMLWWKLALDTVFPADPTLTQPLSGGDDSTVNYGPEYPAVNADANQQFILFNTGVITAISNADGTRGNVEWTGDTGGILHQGPIIEDSSGDFVYQIFTQNGKIYKWGLPNGKLMDGYPYLCESCTSELFPAAGTLSKNGETLFSVTDAGLLIATDVNVPVPQTESPTPAPATPAPTTAPGTPSAAPTPVPTTPPTVEATPEPTNKPTTTSSGTVAGVATACAAVFVAVNVVNLV